MKNKIYFGDTLRLMEQIPSESIDLVCTDPPFNINLRYDTYKDNREYDEYCEWSDLWIKESHRILKPNGSMFVCIGDEFSAEINISLKRSGLKMRNWIVWYYTFGQSLKVKFSRCHTHIHYFTKSEKDFTWNRDDIKVPSARQLKYNDKRAKSGGKTPDDVWEVGIEGTGIKGSLRVLPEDEVIWTDSRVCGTFKERVTNRDGSAHPAQMPLSIMDRIIKCSTNEGDLVFDGFCGTGTTAMSCKRLGRHFITSDVSEEYCKVASNRIFEEESRYESV